MDIVPQPVIIRIKQEITRPPSPKPDVIDLDNFVSTKERIANWHTKVRARIKCIECKASLENTMKWYIETLHEDFFNMEVNNQFIMIMEKHLQCFYSYIKELNWISTDVYLGYMEDLLAFYLDCKGKIYISEKMKRKAHKSQMRLKLLPILKSYLLNQEDSIHHVLMKMKLNLSSKQAKSYLDNIYRVIFAQNPTNKSDGAFCRAFILFQKWKRIHGPEMWNALDEMLYAKYSRGPDSINTNTIWKEISPQRSSLIQIIAQIENNDKIFSDAYFNYIKSQNIHENLSALSVASDEKFAPSSNSSYDEFQSIIKDAQSVDKQNINVAIKLECSNDNEDDDCVIVGETTLEMETHEIVYEILDDDDIEITTKRKEACRNDAEISFLDSIDITQSGLNKDAMNTKNDLPIYSNSSPVPKLQNLDDSVKSREILSRKFTRKKEHPRSIDTYLDLYEPVKSNDFENAFQTTKNKKENATDADNFSLPTPHSTFSNNNSPKTLEIRTSGCYASPTSPHISSTCDPNVLPEEPAPELLEADQIEAKSLENRLEEEPSLVKHDHREMILNEKKSTKSLDKAVSNKTEITSDYSEVKKDQNVGSPAIIEQSEAALGQSDVKLAQNEVTFDQNRVKLDQIEDTWPLTPPIASRKGDTNTKNIRINGVSVESTKNFEFNKSSAINIEHFNLKQISIPLPRSDFSKPNLEKKMGVIYTQKIKKPDNQIHLRYHELKDGHGLDDCLTGDIEKINVSKSLNINVIDDFDLFANNVPSEENHVGSLSPQDTTSSASICQEIERVDDFRHFYLSNYQQDCSKLEENSDLKDSDVGRKENVSEKSDKNKNLLIPTLQNVNNKDSKDLKRKRIVFSTEDSVDNPKPSKKPSNGKIQGILKKPTVDSMVMIRVTYDKTKPFSNESDQIDYIKPGEMKWRSKNPKKVDVEEGTVKQSSDDYIHIPAICTNLCCSFLTNILENLHLCPNIKADLITNTKPQPINPFYQKCPKKKTDPEDSKVSSPNTQEYDIHFSSGYLKLNVVSEIVENYDNCNESLNSIDFINQPAIIPEVEEFEKTMKLEEVTKISTIPSDLNNLNLSKFSPSPVMNCFSPHSSSPNHTFLSDCYCSDKINSDCCNFKDKLTSFHESDYLLIEENLTVSIQDPTSDELELNQENEAENPQEIVEQKNNCGNIAEEESDTRLPLKKRKHSVANAKDEIEDDYIGPEDMEEIIKRARAEESEKDISYPAEPAISIAEIQEKLVDPQPRTFKTPAQKKEMPPPPRSLPNVPQPPNIVTEQYNNHTYNNPTINYHMNNVPYSFFPCTSLTYFPPILLPINSTNTFDVNMVNSQQQTSSQQMPPAQATTGRIKKEKKSRKKKRD